MKIKDQTFNVQGNAITLKEIAISLLENLPSNGDVAASEAMIELADRLGEMYDEMTLTPEDAAMIRRLLNYPQVTLPNRVRRDAYRAFDPSPEVEATE